MTPQRWTDQMLDRQADQIAELQTLANRILEGQQMLVQIYQQEHEARVEADRRFNRFIERQELINQRLEASIERLELNDQRTQITLGRLEITIERIQTEIERLDRIISFRSDNGYQGGSDQ